MTLAQASMGLIVAALFVFACTSVRSNYMIERQEMHDSRGCALFLSLVLGAITVIFWRVP